MQITACATSSATTKTANPLQERLGQTAQSLIRKFPLVERDLSGLCDDDVVSEGFELVDGTALGSLWS